MEKVDIIIRNAMILVQDKEQTILKQHNIAILNHRIHKIYLDTEPTQFQTDCVIDATHCIVIPGFMNSHTHIAMSLFRGIADDLPLHTWLEDHIWPRERKYLSPEFVYDSALLGIAELIKNGITFFSDMYFFGKDTARAANKAGMRALIGEGIVDFPMSCFENPAQMINYTIEAQQEYKNHPRIQFALAPHSIYTCSSDTLKACNRAAELNDMRIHLHLSETEWERNQCIKNNGLNPIDYIEQQGLLRKEVTLAHGVWLDELEMQKVAKNNVSVVINIESNLKLASGFPPIKQYLENQVNLCLGTDGVASNNTLSLFDEMSTLAKLYKAKENDPTFLPARTVFSMANRNAAQALNLDCGIIEEGKLADIVVLDYNQITALPIYDPYSHLIYTFNNSQVRDVIIDGKLVMKNQQLLTIDEEEIKNKVHYYQQQMRLTP